MLPSGEPYQGTEEPCGPSAGKTASGTSERTTGFEPATLTLAR